MSYDLHLLIPCDGEAPIVTARRGNEHSRRATADYEALKQVIARELISCDAALEVFRFDYEAIARSQNISPQEAKAKFSHVEINDLQRNTGLQIMVFGNEASVTVPYWHQGIASTEVLKKIWGYLEILERKGGYVTYDPQLDRILDRSKDFDAVLACYAKTVSQTLATPPSTAVQKRTWWKFW